MKMHRPLILLLVFSAEIGLLFLFEEAILDFARLLGDQEFFKGLGTLLFPAPIAFLLWYWRDIDKQTELAHDGGHLKNETEKVALELKVLEGQALVARERIDNAKLDAALLEEKVRTANLEKEVRVLRAELEQALSRETLSGEWMSEEDLSSAFAYMAGHFTEGVPKESASKLSLALKRFFLTRHGQDLAGRHIAEIQAGSEPEDLYEVLADHELPSVTINLGGRR